MKLNSKSLFAAVVVASFSTAAFAGMEATKTTETKTTEVKTAVDGTKTMTTTTITGKVETVNADAKTIKVTVGEGKEAKVVNVWWTPTTKLMWKNEAKTAATQADLKAGAPVAIMTETNKDGNLVATEVWFVPTEMPVTAPATK